jgi:hypothetical protein
MMARKSLTILILALALAIAAGFGYVKIVRPRNQERSDALANQRANVQNAISTVGNNNQQVDNEAVDTTNWNTYMVEKYGISLKYPSDWKMADKADNSGYSPPVLLRTLFVVYSPYRTEWPNPRVISIEIFQNTSLTKVLRSRIPFDDPKRIHSEKPVSVNNITGTERIVEKFDNCSAQVYLPRKKNVFLIEYQPDPAILGSDCANTKTEEFKVFLDNLIIQP